jgi:hypothetical protein
MQSYDGEYDVVETGESGTMHLMTMTWKGDYSWHSNDLAMA